jgi:hypothetical protein
MIARYIAIAIALLSSTPAYCCQTSDATGDGNEIPSIPFSQIEVDRPLSTLESPEIPLWDVSRVTIDGQHLVGIGPSETSPNHAVVVAWDFAADQFPVVHKLTIPLELASPGLGVAEPDRLVRPVWSAQVINDQLVIHMNKGRAEWAGGFADNPPQGVSLFPDTPKASEVEKYSPLHAPENFGNSFLMFSHVDRNWGKDYKRKLSVLIPFASPIENTAAARKDFRYEWKAIPRTIRTTRGEFYSVFLASDLKTLLIDISYAPLTVFISKRNRPLASRFIVWDIASAKIRHEYLIAKDYRIQTRHIGRPVSSSPSGNLVIYRAGHWASAYDTSKPGIFIVKTVSPWSAVFVPTPAMVHGIVWTDEHNAILVLSRSVAKDEQDAVDTSGDLGGPPQLIPVDFYKAFENDQPKKNP